MSASRWTVLFARKSWQVALEMGFAHAYQHQWVGRGVAGSGTFVGWKVLEFALESWANRKPIHEFQDTILLIRFVSDGVEHEQRRSWRFGAEISKLRFIRVRRGNCDAIL